jgi:hypothetical protein
MQEIARHRRERIIESLVLPVERDAYQTRRIMQEIARVGGAIVNAVTGFLGPPIPVINPHPFFDESAQSLLQNPQCL